MKAITQQLSATSAQSRATGQAASRKPSVLAICGAFAERRSHNANGLVQYPAARRLGLSASQGRASHMAMAAAQTEGVGKLISKVEIPAFIPRADILEQLVRWAIIDVQEAGVANVGCPCKVTPYLREGVLWGFTVGFLKDGVSATDVRVAFDEDTIMKHEWVGRGADGFPVLEGNAESIDGKYFEIRKVDDIVVTENIRYSIRSFCQMLVGAINKYYAFGSCFVDDTT